MLNKHSYNDTHILHFRAMEREYCAYMYTNESFSHASDMTRIAERLSAAVSGTMAPIM